MNPGHYSAQDDKLLLYNAFVRRTFPVLLLRAVLSSRRPRKTGWRNFTSRVHSANFIWRDEDRIDPGAFAHHRRSDALHPRAALFRRKIGERAIGPFFRAEFFVQRREHFAAEPGPDFAGEEQLLFFVIADEKRAEMFARAARRGVTADDEFLFVQRPSA